MEQNSITHQKEREEIALGISLGPVSESLRLVCYSVIVSLHSQPLAYSFRSTSEKFDRPLSRLRPGSAMVERESFKHTTKKLTR